jgi:hypothetical protein
MSALGLFVGVFWQERPEVAQGDRPRA